MHVWQIEDAPQRFAPRVEKRSVGKTRKRVVHRYEMIEHRGRCVIVERAHGNGKTRRDARDDPRNDVREQGAVGAPNVAVAQCARDRRQRGAKLCNVARHGVQLIVPRDREPRCLWDIGHQQHAEQRSDRRKITASASTVISTLVTAAGEVSTAKSRTL